jgi:muramoyltetrapeptide carboxypeptidase LdcA involved in peptidoglycan recycling
MIKPAKLQPGDQVAAISLSWGGPGVFPHRYEVGKRQLEAALGVTVVETPHARRDDDWLWRNPQARADDLMVAFADPSIKAIFSTIGGNDSIRILPYLDLDLMRANPKIFMGFSDTTITHLACFKAGLVSFYGPAIMAGFGENGGLFSYMLDSVRRTICSAQPIGEIRPNMDGWTVEFLDWANPAHQEQKRTLTPSTGWHWLQGRGVQRGRLLGGCLEVLDWLRGADFWPAAEQWQDAILFLEASEEAPPVQWVTYMLRSLAAVGVLQRIAGLLYARPGGQIPPARFVEYDEAIRKVVVEEEGMHELPIITQMDFGHTDPIFVLPYGLLAEIDCDRRRFSILESGVDET